MSGETPATSGTAAPMAASFTASARARPARHPLATPQVPAYSTVNAATIPSAACGRPLAGSGTKQTTT